MKLRPFARAFADTIYRTDYFVVCSAPIDFLPALRKLLTKNVNVGLANGIIDGVSAHSVDECNGRCWRLEMSSRNHIAVIYLRPGADVSVVTHEAWHAAFWVFQERAVRLDCGLSPRDNGADEPMAYYLQWLVRSILKL